MKKRHYFFILSGVVAVCLLFLVIWSIQSPKGVKSEDDPDFYRELFTRSLISHAVGNNGLSVELPLDSAGKLINYHGKEIDLSKPLFICYLNNNACFPCVESLKELIKKNFKNYDSDSGMLFIAAQYNPHMDIGLSNFLHIGRIKLGLPIEKEELPFLFILENKKVSHLFLPDKNLPQYTNNYLKEIKKRYFTTTLMTENEIEANRFLVDYIVSFFPDF